MATDPVFPPQDTPGPDPDVDLTGADAIIVFRGYQQSDFAGNVNVDMRVADNVKPEYVVRWLHELANDIELRAMMAKAADG